jgi:hypothetical protein
MWRAAALAGLVALCATPALAVPAQYDIAFVSEFADACVPQRMSYPGTQQTALAEGWTEVQRTAHPELDAMMAISEREASAPDLQATFEYALYSKSIGEIDHFLVVSRMSAIVGEPGDPLNPWVYIGCYLYNLDATGAIDPEPVTALIGNPISNSQVDDTIVAYVWGPPCPMPRTGDTYLTYVPEGGEYAGASGFSGLVLKFDTSEPGPDEVVPSTYC